MIKLELECTPQQLADIAAVLGGDVPSVKRIGAAKEQTTAVPDLVDYPIMKPEEQTTRHDLTCGSEFPGVGPLQQLPAATVPPAPASPAATAFAADVETAEASFEGVDLAKGTNGQMIPWDARIHGKAKKQNADNSWRLIQGVDRDTLVPQVEAELVAALTAPKAVTAVEESPSEPHSDTNAPIVAPVSAPNTVPSPPTADTAKPATFAELLPLVTAAKAAGTLTDETIASTCVELGLAQFGLIATRPDLIPRAAELLGV